MPASIAIDSNGNLTYASAAGDVTNLIVSYQPAGDTYSFADSKVDGPIAPTPDEAVAAYGLPITSVPPGWTLTTQYTTNAVFKIQPVGPAVLLGYQVTAVQRVAGPGAGVTALSVDLSASISNDVVNIQSTGAPIDVICGAGAGNRVNISSNAPTNTGNLAGIGADASVYSTDGGFVTLTVSDFAATSGNSAVVIGSGAIAAFAGPNDEHTITYQADGSGAGFHEVRLIGSNSSSLRENYTINSPLAAIFQLDSSRGGDSVLITGTDAAATQNNINLGAGNATVTVAPMANVNGPVAFTFASGTSILTLDASKSPSGTTFTENTVNGVTTVTGASPAPITYRATGGGTVVLNTISPP